MSITDTAAGTTAHERTFWRSDYARFARAIRRTRHVMGDEHTAKSAGHQARCDELAGAVAALFQADAPGAFSGEKFSAGTLLAGRRPPPMPPAQSRRSLMRGQVELARSVGRYPGDQHGAFGLHVREGRISGQHGGCPGAAGAQAMHVRGGAHAAVRPPAGSHVSRMPEPVPGIRTVFWQLPARVCSRGPGRSRNVIGLPPGTRTCNRRSVGHDMPCGSLSMLCRTGRSVRGQVHGRRG